MVNEMYQAIANYHTALMGNDLQELNEAEAAFNKAKSAYGDEEYNKQMDNYNEMLRGI